MSQIAFIDRLCQSPGELRERPAPLFPDSLRLRRGLDTHGEQNALVALRRRLVELVEEGHDADRFVTEQKAAGRSTPNAIRSSPLNLIWLLVNSSSPSASPRPDSVNVTRASFRSQTLAPIPKAPTRPYDRRVLPF